MTRDLRVVFAGGKNVGHGCLEYLLADHSPATVVTVLANGPEDASPTRWYPSVTELALAAGIPVMAPRRANRPDVLECLRSLEPDLLVCVYYDQILRRPLLDIPRLGAVNLHLALAEEYRGCFPTTWAILNGERRTGVTLHYMTEDIDAGDIIAQREVECAEHDTGRSLYDKCTAAGVALFKETFPRIAEGTADRRPQRATERTRYYPRALPSREVDPNLPLRKSFRRIRALTFPPFPPPFFELDGVPYEIVPAEGSRKPDDADSP